MSAENKKLVSPEEFAQQKVFASRILRENGANTAETGAVRRYWVDCYGCQQNEADAETLRGQLRAMGYAAAACAEDADVVLINTCAIREHAEARELGNIGALVHVKRRRPGMVIGVCGCMPQQSHMAEKLRRSFPYVDLVFGTHAVWKLPELLWHALHDGKRVFDTEDTEGRIAEGLPVERRDREHAWVSIMYGCNNFCTYCIVPYVRGRERSREPEYILEEVRGLIGIGCRDITLLGQNVNSYGSDREDGIRFPELLRRIDAIDGDFIVRFMTSHPKDASHELIDTIAESRHMARGIHLPVQSGSDRVLQRMNRRYTAAQYIALIDYAREKIPNLVITSDIIVGFPGETEEDFQATLDLVERVRYDSLFTFLYSKRVGTPAAEMPDDTPEEEKQARFDRLLALQNRISQEIHDGYVGKIIELRLDREGRAEGYPFSARTSGGRLVHVRAPLDYAGKLARVRIERASTYALFGAADL
ncbi:MAG: tRNA (N6-isopentenyl adenosine(37)-C2)-methylthiotransferase MiaB [Clostridiaceae bacterium]|nr:tRNA (N6-isopentenyl adenosine(37)-C2)-methylthiotransferase MiaB [Clostridiaceae bacterium]